MRYTLETREFMTELTAESLEAARRTATAAILGRVAAEDRTFWIAARLEGPDAPGGVSFLEPIDPDEPPCVAPTEDIAAASAEYLGRVWATRARDWGEHRWSEPYELVGGLLDNPGVRGHGSDPGVTVTSVCLRCGTARIVDTWATDPDSGVEGLRSVEYSPRAFAREIESRFYNYRATFDYDY